MKCISNSKANLRSRLSKKKLPAEGKLLPYQVIDLNTWYSDFFLLCCRPYPLSFCCLVVFLVLTAILLQYANFSTVASRENRGICLSYFFVFVEFFLFIQGRKALLNSQEDFHLNQIFFFLALNLHVERWRNREFTKIPSNNCDCKSLNSFLFICLFTSFNFYLIFHIII